VLVVQLEVPENHRPTIYFEDSFKGDKLVEFKSYIAEISRLVPGYEGSNSNFQKQVIDFVKDINKERMDTNKEMVNINRLSSWLPNVYPILVVDSDGMNPESIDRVIEESINEHKIPNHDRAGGYDFLEELRHGNFFGKFAVIIQCHNLETCKFERFEDGISLQTNETKNAVLGIKKNDRKRYQKGNWKVSLDSATPKYLPFLVENQRQTLMEPDSFNTILEPFFEIHTSSIYLKKPDDKLYTKVVQLQYPDATKLNFHFGEYKIPKTSDEEE